MENDETHRGEPRPKTLEDLSSISCYKCGEEIGTEDEEAINYDYDDGYMVWHKVCPRDLEDKKKSEEETTRNYFDEAVKIISRESLMLPQREHLIAVYGNLNRAQRLMSSEISKAFESLKKIGSLTIS